MIINVFGDFVTDESPNKIILGDELKDSLNKASFNICNFEGPVAGVGIPIKKSGPNLSIHADSPSWLKKNNFNIVTLANNHIMDYGEEALFTTLKNLQEINAIGAGTWENAYKPLIIEQEGKKIAFIALTHCEFGTLTDQYDKRHTCGTAWINHDNVNTIILNLKKETDYIIVLAHCGYEHLEQPLPEWRTRYKSLIDCGCDIVIASHPHIIQGYETYKGKPIFYSLGNFFFPHNYSGKDSWAYSLCVEIDINDSISFKIHPIHFNTDSIDICKKNDSIYTYIENVNAVLSNYTDYISYINEECDKLLNLYYPRLETNRKLRLSEMFLEKIGLTIHPIDYRLHDVLSILNNFRCESHRWCIARALKNRYGIQ